MIEFHVQFAILFFPVGFWTLYLYILEYCRIWISRIEWYFDHDSDYPHIKGYVEILNYLRLLIIEYINESC